MKAEARDAAILEAGQLAASGRWADARAAYLAILSGHEDDAEALFGLARVDAWEGCQGLAESEYTRVISAHAKDADVRAGLVDLLMWQERFDEADRMLADGLALDPRSPALLARRARLTYWRGDATEAVRLADQAERLAPGDGDLRAMRDRMFLGEARVTGHVDRYPPGYQDLYALAGQVLQRIRRYEVYGGVQLLQRYGGNNNDAVLDARYPIGALYHPALGVTFGAEIAPGLPSNAIPDVALRVWANTPVARRLSAFVSYSFWHYRSSEIVNILSPSLEISLPRDVRLDLRAWLSGVTLPRPAPSTAETKVTGAAGLQIGWSVTPRIDVSAWYTYGAELDQNPALYQLLEFRSHQVGASTDILFNRYQGLRPLVALDRREGPTSTIWIASFEIGAYVRW